MARVQYGSIVSGLSGSIGGVTFQRGIYGNVVRSKPLPMKTPSPSQARIRAFMLRVENAWTNLSQDQRRQWQIFTDYSLPTCNKEKGVLLKGHALFIKYQMLRLISGLDLLSLISYEPMLAVPSIQDIYLRYGKLWIAFSDDIFPVIFFFSLKLSMRKPESKKFHPPGLRCMFVPPSEDNTYDISDVYLSTFGVLPLVDQFIHYSVTWFNVKSPVFYSPVVGVWQVNSY